jgi:hypothetical protein
MNVIQQSWIINTGQQVYFPRIADGTAPLPYRPGDEANSETRMGGPKIRRKTMKTMILAAAATLALGVGAAYAGDGDGYSATTVFTSLPGVEATVAQSAPGPRAEATNQYGVTHAYVTTSHSGTWLYPPAQDSGAQ